MSTNSPNTFAESVMTVPKFRDRTGTSTPLVCLTAYTTPMAKILDRHCDLLLVGDSVGTVLHGLPNTLGVTLEHMILHGQAVVRGARNALVIVDMPYGSYEESPQMAFRNAGRLVKETGCAGIKLEWHEGIEETVSYLVDRGIPVMGHVGLLPQSFNSTGGYKAIRDANFAQTIIDSALSFQRAGAFSIVIEGVAETIVKDLVKQISIPTIGIGASAHCDGQILVTEDMLGLFPNVAKFVKKFSDMENFVDNAVQKYAAEVREKKFPSTEHIYTTKAKEIK